MRTNRLFAISLAIVVSSISAYGTAPCPLNQQNPSVTVCTPAPNALVQSMVHVVAGSTDSNPVTSMQVYLDGTLMQTVKGSSTVDTFLSVALGYHTITVKGWTRMDRSKRTFRWRCSRRAR